ncbi:hypothetical protein GCM10027048_29470 [Hymenobacter coalescens]
MASVIKPLLSLPLLLTLAYLLYLNAVLYQQPATVAVAGQRLDADVLAQLRYLRGPLHDGAAQDMQELYPEGFVFLNALYGLAWSEVAAAVPAGDSLHRRAVDESRWASRQIASEPGRVIFDADLPLPYGAFYNGWLAYSLGRLLRAQHPAQRHPADVALFRSTCARIAAGLISSADASPFPESYRGAAWPADATVCAAALATYDQIYGLRYRPLLHRWLRRVQARVDTLGLIPHAVDARTGRVTEGARGSSQSLMLSLLHDIDPAFGRRQYQQYRRYFVDSRLGLPGIREYPQGQSGWGDVDSGPVLLGIGGAASVVGRRAAQQYDDTVLAAGLRNSLSAFGMAHTRRGQRSYLFGQLPIADAFLAWTNAVAVSPPLRTPGGWRGWFQLFSVGVALGVAWLYRRQPRRRPPVTPPTAARGGEPLPR